MPFVEVEAHRVHYEQHGDGDPVLMINGLGADHGAWSLQTDHLKRFYRVLVFDNPGVGLTEGPGVPTRPRSSQTSPPVSPALFESNARTSSAPRWAG